MGTILKKSQYLGIILLSTILGSIFLAGFAVAIDPFYPEPDAVEGYDLIWERVITVSNPLNASAPTIGTGSQIWTKSDAANEVTAVVGVVIFKFSEDVFGKRIPLALRQALYLVSTYEKIKTYWDLLVASVTENAEVSEISDLIKTTDGSIEFNLGGGAYMILSKDAEYLFFSFGFEISNDWATYVDLVDADVNSVFEAGITVVAGLLAIFQTAILWVEGNLPIPEAPPIPSSSSALGQLLPPTGDPTAAADVQYLTIQIGSLYGTSNLLWIILGAVGAVIVIGGIIFIVRRRK